MIGQVLRESLPRRADALADVPCHTSAEMLAGYASVKRIQSFLVLSEKAEPTRRLSADEAFETSGSVDKGKLALEDLRAPFRVVVKDGSFGWDDKTVVLEGINLELTPGELHMVRRVFSPFFSLFPRLSFPLFLPLSGRWIRREWKVHTSTLPPGRICPAQRLTRRPGQEGKSGFPCVSRLSCADLLASNPSDCSRHPDSLHLPRNLPL